MKSFLFAALAAATLLAQPLHAQEKRPEVDTNEVHRRISMGVTQQDVGEGHRSGAAEEAATVAATPADDNNRWHIDLYLGRGDRWSEQLLRDFATNVRLQSFADASAPGGSWSHFNVYWNDDPSQVWRWKDKKVTQYPTIIVKPPLNGSRGPKDDVVMAKVGYDGKADTLAGEIGTWVRLRVEKFPSGGGGFQQVGDSRTAPFRNDSNPANPAWPTPVTEDPPHQATPAPSGAGFFTGLLTALAGLGGLGGAGTLIYYLIKLQGLVRQAEVAAGKTPLVPAAVFSMEEKIADAILARMNQQKQNAPAPSGPA